MNKPTRASLLALLITLGISATVSAQNTAPAANADSMQAYPEGQAHAATPPAGKQQVPKPGDRSCIQNTGSLIPAKPGSCLPVAGRSYNRQEIQNTGEPTLGPALQKLDPSVTVRGGH